MSTERHVGDILAYFFTFVGKNILDCIKSQLREPKRVLARSSLHFLTTRLPQTANKIDKFLSKLKTWFGSSKWIDTNRRFSQRFMVQENSHTRYSQDPAVMRKISAKDLDLQWFAAEDEGRSEEPSEHKLKKARDEGRVAKSQELSSALVMLFPVLAIIILAPWLFNNFIEIILFYFQRCTTAELNGSLAYAFFYYFLKMVTPIAIIAIIAGVLANLVQNRGFIFSTKPIEPKFSKLIPNFPEYFRKTMFSFEGVFNVFKSLLKVAIIFFVAYIIIKDDLPQLLSLLNVNLWQGIVHIAGMTAKILVISAIIFLIIAIFDYLVQRKQFIESMKMTKQDVKEEYKEMEGDPLVKARLKQFMQELLRGNIRENVAKADVVITNPTHFAIALFYEIGMDGPRVVAKGQDNLAQQIKKIAQENNVPMVENRPLARELYAQVELGAIIPSDYYSILANILVKVGAMKGKKK